ncbi:MAG: hypothetical protein IPG74_15425 [Flavobacteriales bacterium]|nr:hypothetical protein [Flavobacteriales bacterium]
MNVRCQVSEGLIQQYPDEYNVLMANAVALELSGSTPWALALLKQAVALDPARIVDREWIHVNILEARVRNSTSQVTPAELIGIDLSADQIVAATPREKLDTLLNQLLYQLNDRYFFVQEAPDQIFGAMLYAYADLLFLTDRQTISARYYDMAEEYGFRPTGNTARRDKARQKHKLAEARRESGGS